MDHTGEYRSKRRLMVTMRLLRPVFHACLIILSFWLMYLFRTSTDLIPFVQLRVPVMDGGETMLFALLSAMMFLALGRAHGLYELQKPLHNYYVSFLKIWLWWFVLVSALAYYGFGYIFIGGISRFVIVWGACVVWVIITIWDMRWNALNTYLEQQDPYRIALFSTNVQLTESIVGVLGTYTIYTAVTYDKNNIPHPGGLSSFDIIILAGSHSNETLQTYADYAKISGQLFYYVSDHHMIEDIIPVPTRMGPLLVLEYIASPLDGWWRVLKRMFDLVVSVAAIILLSPLFACIALIIKRDSPGPVFYYQKRVGKGHKAFTFIKFRSMYTHLSTGEQYGGDQARKLKEKLINSDANVRPGVLSKIKDDPRVTKVGAFLRKTSLDELPNLFSVFLGTMSIVGPRPHEPHEVARYTGWQKRLFTIKPGITGYAQLFGRDELPFEEEAKLDLRYIQHWSLLLDMYILVTTIKVIFRGK